MFTRILSAVVALPIVIFLVELGGWPFAALVTFVGGACLWEFMGMTLPGDRLSQGLFTGVGVLLMLLTFTGALASLAAPVVLGAATVGTLVYFLFRTGDMGTVAPRMAFAVTGLFWAGLLLAITGSLRALEGGAGWLYMACVLAWGSDTGAYFAGKALGKHKLYEKVSPKKTWEGAIGGVLVATGGAFLLSWLYGPAIPPLHLMVLAPLGSILGQVGDLAESLLKRSVGVKDSGRIMPGHGGLFDRVDALIFAGPTLFAYAVLVARVPITWLSLP